MKSDRPKSISFMSASSLLEVKRKFCKSKLRQRMDNIIDTLILILVELEIEKQS